MNATNDSLSNLEPNYGRLQDIVTKSLTRKPLSCRGVRVHSNKRSLDGGAAVVQGCGEVAIVDRARQAIARLRICAALCGLSKTALLAGIFCASVIAQTTKLRFTHLSVADGLSNPDVRAIAQDRQGFMWCGTWLGGLNRYDGYTFKVYKHDDQDEHSLGSNSIWALYVDRAGILWVGTNEGVDRYDRNTDSFIHYRYSADDPSRPPTRVFPISTLTHQISFAQTSSSNQARSLIEDKSGNVWAATSGGLSRFDRTSARFFTLRPNPNDPTSFGDTNL